MESIPLTYRKHQTLFDKTEWEWRLEPHALIETNGTGQTREIKWPDIAMVRLCFAPTKMKTWRFYCRLRTVNEQTVEIDNVNYIGFGNFQNLNSKFVPFIQTLLNRLAQEKPGMNVHLGENAVLYLFHLFFVLGSFALLLFVFTVLSIPLDSLPGMAILKFGIILFFLPVLFKWAMQGFPRRIGIAEVSSKHLPQV